METGQPVVQGTAHTKTAEGIEGGQGNDQSNQPPAQSPHPQDERNGRQGEKYKA